MGFLAGRKTRLILGVSMLLFGLIGTFSPKTRVQGSVLVAWDSVSVVAAAIRRPFQLRQAGILGRKLFRWQDLQDYYISPKGGLTLKLSGEWSGCVGRVPPPRRQEAASLIAAKIPVHAGPTA
jgi:hypothetical protein